MMLMRPFLASLCLFFETILIVATLIVLIRLSTFRDVIPQFPRRGSCQAGFHRCQSRRTLHMDAPQFVRGGQLLQAAQSEIFQEQDGGAVELGAAWCG